MSSIDPKFRELHEYGGEDGARRVGQLEDNVKAALANIAQQALPLFSPTNLKTSAYTAKLDEHVPCAGTFPVTLPVASSVNQGRHVGVEVKGGTVTVGPATGLVNGAATVSCATVGFYDFVSNGVGWTVAATSAASGVASVTAGAGLVNSGTATNPVVDAVAANPTIVVHPDSIEVGVISDANVDDTIVTEVELSAGVKRLRLELQHIRLLVGQLVDIEVAGG